MAASNPAITKRSVIEYLRKRLPSLEMLGIKTFIQLETFLSEREDEQLPAATPVPPPRPVRVIHSGHTVKIPKPVVLVDTREREGFSYTFDRFSKWFAGVEHKALRAGDYSIQGLERVVAIERKSLADLVNNVITDRARFLAQCRALGSVKRKAIVIEAGFAETKSPYLESMAHPNAVVGSLIALQERWGIQVIWCDDGALAEEVVAHILSKHHTLHWLKENELPRHFVDYDI